MTLKQEVEMLRDRALSYSIGYKEDYRLTGFIDKLALELCHMNYYNWLQGILDRERRRNEVV
jgi:hypothetical protein